jgi:hypothetical protein
MPQNPPADRARRAWVLDTETKGTGAQMVPLEKTQKRTPSSGILIPREPRPRPAKPPEAKQPRRFRVVDVMTQQTLAEDVGTHEATELLRDVRSIVDVSVYVWVPTTRRWRPLGLAERRVLWEAAREANAAT